MADSLFFADVVEPEEPSAELFSVLAGLFSLEDAVDFEPDPLVDLVE